MEKIKQEQIAREALEKFLLPEEQLLATGKFDKQISFMQTLFVPPLVNAFIAIYYWVGVTKNRLIFIPLDSFDKPNGSECYSLDRADVISKYLVLTVVLPNSPRPQKLLPNFGLKRNSGFDDKAFRAAMEGTFDASNHH